MSSSNRHRPRPKNDLLDIAERIEAITSSSAHTNDTQKAALSAQIAPILAEIKPLLDEALFNPYKYNQILEELWEYGLIHLALDTLRLYHVDNGKDSSPNGAPCRVLELCFSQSHWRIAASLVDIVHKWSVGPNVKESDVLELQTIQVLLRFAVDLFVGYAKAKSSNTNSSNAGGQRRRISAGADSFMRDAKESRCLSECLLSVLGSIRKMCLKSAVYGAVALGDKDEYLSLTLLLRYCGEVFDHTNNNNHSFMSSRSYQSNHEVEIALAVMGIVDATLFDENSKGEPFADNFYAFVDNREMIGRILPFIHVSSEAFDVGVAVEVVSLLHRLVQTYGEVMCTCLNQMADNGFYVIEDLEKLGLRLSGKDGYGGGKVPDIGHPEHVLGLLQKLKANNASEEYSRKQYRSAAVIQSVWRGKRDRERLNSLSKVIQRVVDGFRKKRRKSINERKKSHYQETALLEEERSKRSSRLSYKEKQLELLASLPADKVEIYLERKKMEAIIKAQACFRGFLVRKRMPQLREAAKREESARLIQARYKQHKYFRDKNARKRMAMKRQMALEAEITASKYDAEALLKLTDLKRIELQAKIVADRRKFMATVTNRKRTPEEINASYREAQKLLGEYSSKTNNFSNESTLRRIELLLKTENDFNLLLENPPLTEASNEVISKHFIKSAPLKKAAAENHIKDLRTASTPWWRRLEEDEDILTSDLRRCELKAELIDPLIVIKGEEKLEFEIENENLQAMATHADSDISPQKETINENPVPVEGR
eukprot:Nk52_evm50s2118 gene=Nk52_evmTU50s2118